MVKHTYLKVYTNSTMGVGIIKRDAFRCERCGHEWISEKFTPDNPPISCAKCKSPYWNVKR